MRGVIAQARRICRSFLPLRHRSRRQLRRWRLGPRHTRGLRPASPSTDVGRSPSRYAPLFRAVKRRSATPRIGSTRFSRSHPLPPNPVVGQASCLSGGAAKLALDSHPMDASPDRRDACPTTASALRFGGSKRELSVGKILPPNPVVGQASCLSGGAAKLALDSHPMDASPDRRDACPTTASALRFGGSKRELSVGKILTRKPVALTACGGFVLCSPQAAFSSRSSPRTPCRPRPVARASANAARAGHPRILHSATDGLGL